MRRWGSFTTQPPTPLRPERARSINTAELNLVQKFYPIVFTPDSPHQAIAILGIGNNQNLFVDEEGGWPSGRDIPAYVRGYPLISLNLRTRNISSSSV